jgi:hypothetical protein
MKTLKPVLPKDVKEIELKGWRGNISTHEKFVTDGHSMILASAAVPEFKPRKYEDGVISHPTLKAMQVTWDAANDRPTIPAHFIGCGIAAGSETVIAVIRDDNSRVLIVDPYILKYAMSAVEAESLHVSAGPKYDQDPLIIFHGTSIVALVMPMRYTRVDLREYDLPTEPVDIRTL